MEDGTTRKTQAMMDMGFYADEYHAGNPHNGIHLLAVAGLHFRFFQMLPSISHPVPAPVPTSNWMDMRMHSDNFCSMVQNTIKSYLKNPRSPQTGMDMGTDLPLCFTFVTAVTCFDLLAC